MESAGCIRGNDELVRKNFSFENHGIVHTKEWRSF